MLWRLIHNARVNMFESARFYYSLILTLLILSFFKGALNKWVYVYTSYGNEIEILKIITGSLYATFYLALIGSAIFIYKKLVKKIFFYWVTIVAVSLFNEVNYAITSSDYNFFYSLLNSQAYFYLKFTLPLLFFSVWPALKNESLYGEKILEITEFFLKVNACFILLGALINLPFFESYPLSGRWGYSGLLFHKSLNNILYGIFLIRHCTSKNQNFITITLFTISLLLMGQKAGLLYLFLFFSLIIVKNKTIRILLLSVAGIVLAFASYWFPFVVKLSPFWQAIYEKHGSLGTILSLRNENISRIFENAENFDFLSVLLGGISRYPEIVEMFPFDLFIYFGVVGLISSLAFYKYWVPNLKVWIPIIVAGFSGVLYELILGMILYGIWANEEKKRI